MLAAGSGPDAGDLAARTEGLVVVQFAGAVPVDRLQAAAIRVEPPHALAPRRMARTLAHLGPRPVVELHAAGLKVGELLWRRRRDGTEFGEHAGLVQEL